jgi:hypothetical protein
VGRSAAKPLTALELPPLALASTLLVPQTPGTRPLPGRFAHAYSPAKPSPLSRILMLAASPPSPGAGPVLTPLPETDSEDADASPDVSPTPAPTLLPPAPRGKKQSSLAAELGLPDSDPEDVPPPAKNAGKARARLPASAATRVTGTEKENGAKRVRPAAPAPAPAPARPAVARPPSRTAAKAPAPTRAPAPTTQRAGAGLMGAPKTAPKRVVPAAKRPFA